MEMGLGGRTVLVSGATGGIGQKIAIAFGREGCNVLVHYRSKKEVAEWLVEEIQGYGVCAKAYQADLESPQQTGEMLKEITRKRTAVDILINNAAVPGSLAPLSEVTRGELERVMQVNFYAAFQLASALLPGMCVRQWGRIVNIGSLASDLGGARQLAYASSKSALHALTTAIAVENGRHGITANTVSIGYTDEGMMDQVPVAMKQKLFAKILTGDPVTADEIASLLVYLASDLARSMTGLKIPLNGGIYFG